VADDFNHAVESGGSAPSGEENGSGVAAEENVRVPADEEGAAARSRRRDGGGVRSHG
jgi:hypothetical protein